MLEMLTRLAGGGRALELGIGTGRVALPLAHSGVKMFGIDSSPAMLQKLRSKPGSEQIQIHQGSFINIPFQEKFDLVLQIITSQFIVLDKSKIDVKPVKIRYAWPSELDLMARLAGLKSVYHWNDWGQSVYSSSSGKHIAIYGRD